MKLRKGTDEDVDTESLGYPVEIRLVPHLGFPQFRSFEISDRKQERSGAACAGDRSRSPSRASWVVGEVSQTMWCIYKISLFQLSSAPDPYPRVRCATRPQRPTSGHDDVYYPQDRPHICAPAVHRRCPAGQGSISGEKGWGAVCVDLRLRHGHVRGGPAATLQAGKDTITSAFSSPSKKNSVVSRGVTVAGLSHKTTTA